MTVELLGEGQTVELLAQCEDKIGELYQHYAGLFPEEEEFWAKLARDEVGHARWVRALLPPVQRGQVTFREDRLGSQGFLLFYDYLVLRLREVQAHPISLIAALTVAVDIENTLVEKSFYDVFQSTDAEATRILTLLTRSAEAHLKATKDRWRRHQR